MSGVSIEQMKQELADAGWRKLTAVIWQSPDGGFFRGPFGAWKCMKIISRAKAREVEVKA